MTLDFLDETHRYIADRRLRPHGRFEAGGHVGDVRPQHHRALVCDVFAFGYTAEVLRLVRALHEPIATFPQPEGSDVVRKWLADEGT